uniref:Uncharacterized protein n=1 Tax=Zea mays TaxID=4577 RepID=A0A804PCT4_MAIZE
MRNHDAATTRHPAVEPAQLHFVVWPSALRAVRRTMARERRSHDQLDNESDRANSRSYQEHGVPGGEGQDVGAGHHVPALRVAVHRRLGAHHRAEPFRLQHHAVGAPPLVAAGRVDEHHRRVAALKFTREWWHRHGISSLIGIIRIIIARTYPDRAVVEEEPERGRGGERRERHGLPHGAADNALEVRADAGVVVRPQLRLGRRHQRKREEEDGGGGGGQELEAPHGTAAS